MHIRRKCKTCGVDFIAIKVTQFFHSRKCFKKEYYLRTREISRQEEQSKKYPTKTCLFCELSSQLNFDPVRSPEKFDAWGCPHCGATNQLVWEHRNHPQSFQVISEILVSIQSIPSIYSVIQPQYETYRLPVLKQGLGDSSVIVMTCETLDVAQIQNQKKNKKKLLFS